MYKIIALFIIFNVYTFGQEVHKVPFASVNNNLELSVKNTLPFAMSKLTVKVNNAPEWVKFMQREYSLKNVASGAEQGVYFCFDVDKSAKVEAEDIIQIEVSNLYGKLFTKDIKIRVSAPEKFEILQNYPNPFNPSTTISYQLPVQSKVELKIYDVLGKELTSLVNETQAPGFYTKLWDAANYSSGTYIYCINVKGIDGSEKFVQRKMMLVK